jgi:hypothetical protein
MLGPDERQITQFHVGREACLSLMRISGSLSTIQMQARLNVARYLAQGGSNLGRSGFLGLQIYSQLTLLSCLLAHKWGRSTRARGI